jgi:Tetraspanin family
MIGVAAWGLQSEQAIAAEPWMLRLVLAFGVIVTLISFLGIYGAKVAPNKIDNGATNWYLIIYLVIVFIGFVIQVIGAAMLLVLIGNVEDSQDNRVGEATTSFERDLMETLCDHRSKWIDIQDAFDCCGYGFNNGTQDIGSPCNLAVNATMPVSCIIAPTQARGPPCRTKFLDRAKDLFTAVAVAGIIFGVAQLLAMCSAVCLLCCSKTESYGNAQ